jgi:hypothetical protein
MERPSMKKSGNVFKNIAEAAEEEKQWIQQNPNASIGEKFKSSVRAVERATGADLKPSIGRIFSLYCPVPVESAKKLDCAIDEWGEKRKQKKAKKKS